METLPLAAPAHDMSIYGLFMQAGWIVKAVMIGLLAASIWSWAIIIDKSMAYARMRRQLARFEENFWSGQSLEELYRTLADRKVSGMGALFVAAMREWKKSFEKGARSPIALQTRIEALDAQPLQPFLAELGRVDADLRPWGGGATLERRSSTPALSPEPGGAAARAFSWISAPRRGPSPGAAPGSTARGRTRTISPASRLRL